jgi:sugar phosphate isomerase/epimerase
MPLAAALSQIAQVAASAEVCSWGRHSLLEPENARALETSGLPFTVHGPFTHDGIGSRLRSKRRAAIDLHRRHLSVAAELKARLYVVHPDQRSHKRKWSRGTAAALERSFAELRSLQDEFGVSVVVENMPFVGHSHFTGPGDLDLQGLDMALDVGHAAIAGTLEAWLAAPGVRVSHIHLHDNHGRHGYDLHRPLGTGVVDAAPALALARAAGATVVLEHIVPADVHASLEHLHKRGLISGERTAGAGRPQPVAGDAVPVDREPGGSRGGPT